MASLADQCQHRDGGRGGTKVVCEQDLGVGLNVAFTNRSWSRKSRNGERASNRVSHGSMTPSNSGRESSAICSNAVKVRVTLGDLALQLDGNGPAEWTRLPHCRGELSSQCQKVEPHVGGTGTW